VVCNPPLAQIGELGACAALVRLDLSGNQLTSLAGLEALQQLKWLSASGNALHDTAALRALSNLRVSHCACDCSQDAKHHRVDRSCGVYVKTLCCSLLAPIMPPTLGALVQCSDVKLSCRCST